MSSKPNPFIKSMIGSVIGWLLIIVFLYFLYQAIFDTGSWEPVAGVLIIGIVSSLLGRNFSATAEEFEEWNADHRKKKFYELLRSRNYSMEEIEHEWKRIHKK